MDFSTISHYSGIVSLREFLGEKKNTVFRKLVPTKEGGRNGPIWASIQSNILIRKKAHFLHFACSQHFSQRNCSLWACTLLSSWSPMLEIDIDRGLVEFQLTLKDPMTKITKNSIDFPYHIALHRYLSNSNDGWSCKFSNN